MHWLLLHALGTGGIPIHQQFDECFAAAKRIIMEAAEASEDKAPKTQKAPTIRERGVAHF